MNDTEGTRAGRREWIGLAVLMLPTLLIAIDLTVLHLAVPALSRDLAPSSAQLLWIVDIYGFLIAGSLITMGTLGDRIGRRKLLLIGAGAFGVASVIAALANSAEMLIASRALLGIAGATLMPSTQSLIRTLFPHAAQRTVAIGIWISGFSAGSAIGPLLGGWLLEYFWWGSVFLLGVPVMVLLLVLGPIFLPESRDPAPGPFDLLSAALSLAAVLLAIFGIKRIVESGLTLVPILTIVAGLTLGAVFIRRQRQLATPLLDLGLFANRLFSVSLGTNALAFFVQFGMTFATAQYLQLVLGLSPFAAGLWTVPPAAAFIIGSNLAPRLAEVVRPVRIIVAGLLISTVGVGLLTQAGAVNGLPVLIGSLIGMSAGLSLVITLTTDMVLSAAPAERAGAAAALSETGIEFGGALGIAILGSIGTAVYRGAMAADLPAAIAPTTAAAARDTLGGAIAVAEQLTGATAATLLAGARDAFVAGLHVIAIVSAVLLAALALLVWRLLSASAAPAAPIAVPGDRDRAAAHLGRAA